MLKHPTLNPALADASRAAEETFFAHLFKGSLSKLPEGDETMFEIPGFLDFVLLEIEKIAGMLGEW